MKKIILCTIAVIAAATMCACGNASTVNEAVNAAKQEKIENMTAAKAAGIYALSDMTDIGMDKTDLINEEMYDKNTITLTENGEYTLSITIGEQSEKKTGRYEVAANGVVTLDGGETYIAAKGEEILCNGKSLIFQGKLGTQLSATMVYEKESAQENTESESEAETAAE